ncbi:CoA-binding protein [Microbacterium protaetiae]|uniref:CoA-binding protein n=1 Tax=Microbacterium protaetiae TaxID=2509458 RepID=A0A4P6EDV3_9MICO|nr:acetate--CoA ligase family protein [Microbacterium protaetiae]QAY59926.1 CoA-binding protein [Microbacterium protaetiae]
MTFRTAQVSRMLRPQSIGLLGTSAQRFAAGNEVLANLVEKDFGGSIHLCHPSATLIDGFPVVARIDQLPADLDTAVVCLPAPVVVPALRALEARGCNSAVVPSSGFSPEAAADFAAFVRTSDMVVHGPNNMGIINLTDDVALWIQHAGVARLHRGNVGLVAQSGSAAIFVPRSTRDGLFSKLISTGSEWQLTSADYIEWLAHDEATDAIGLVLESVVDTDRFRAAVAAARAADKPLVALKVGRTRAGQRATVAHTGALAAPDDSYRALFRDLDIPTVDDYDELAAVLEVFSRPRRSARGTRIAATTVSGGQSALLADLAARHDVAIAPLTNSTRSRLNEAIPGGVPAVPVDIGGGTGHGSYPDALRALANDETVDVVVVVCDAQDTLSLAELEVERSSWQSVNALYRETEKPILMASSSAMSVHPIFAREVTAPVAIVRGLGPALAAVRALAANRREAPHAPDRGGLPTAEVVTELRQAVAECTGAIGYELTARVLSAYGIATAAGFVASDGEEAVRRRSALSFPLVAKVVSPTIAHRTEHGCVITGIEDDATLREAVDLILHRASAIAPGEVDAVEVQEQVDTTVEAVVGFTTSPHGAYVIVGSGGVLVELLADVAGSLAPFDAGHARELIAQTRLATVLAGYRGIIAATDIHPLADLVHRVSVLASDFAGLITELDLNPVLIRPGDGQVYAVDALLVVQHPVTVP